MTTHKAMFGISVFRQSLTKAVVADTVEYMDARYEDCLVIIVDGPEAHNWMLRNRFSQEHALEAAERMASQRVNMVQRVLRSRRASMPVVTWRWLAQDPLYKQNVETIIRYYRTHAKFRNDVQDQLHVYLGGYIAGCRKRLGRPLDEAELDEAAHFLLEEIAGLAYLHFDKGFSTDIYPGSAGKVTEDLFNGRDYFNLVSELRIRPEEYQYIDTMALSNLP